MQCDRGAVKTQRSRERRIATKPVSQVIQCAPAGLSYSWTKSVRAQCSVEARHSGGLCVESAQDIFVSSAIFDILHVMPSSIILTYIKKRRGPSTEA